MPGEKPSAVVIQLGKRRLEGWAAMAILLVIVALLAGWIVSRQPYRDNPAMWISAAGWILFTIYWSAAAKNASKAQRSESAKSRRVHQLLLNGGLLLLFVALPGLRWRFLPQQAALPPAGLAMQAAFAALGVWARRHLGKHWSGEITIKVDHQLIRSGPYRLLRHPIYTAILGMYAGTALVSGQGHALVGTALAGVAYARKIRLEEANLREAFGDEYEQYRRKSWALVPFVY